MTSLADAIDLVRPCVVQVGVGGDQIRPIPTGTGFMVDSAGYVLTARHVTRGARALVAAQQIQNGRLLIGLAQPNTENVRANCKYSVIPSG